MANVLAKLAYVLFTHNGKFYPVGQNSHVTASERGEF
jgi:hypothetical protein